MRKDTFAHVTPAILQSLGCPKPQAEKLAVPITQTMGQYGVDSAKKQAHFLGQILTESGYLRYTEEVWGPTRAQKGYDTRTDLGNTPKRDGDGYKYRGRGLIQVTGRANYARFGAHLHSHHGLRTYDLTENPSPVSEPPLNCICAGWYWASHGINDVAGRGIKLRHVKMVTEIVNGGHNHLKKRYDITTGAYPLLLMEILRQNPEKVPVFAPETAQKEIDPKHLHIAAKKP